MKTLKDILDISWKIILVIIIGYVVFTVDFDCKPDTIIDIQRDTVVVRDTVKLPADTVRLRARPVKLTSQDSADIFNSLQARFEAGKDSAQIIEELAQPFEADTTIMFVNHDSTNAALNDTTWVVSHIKAFPIDKTIEHILSVNTSTSRQLVSTVVTVEKGETFWDGLLGVGEDALKVTGGIVIGYLIATGGGN